MLRGPHGQGEAGAQGHGSNAIFVTCILTSGVSVDNTGDDFDQCHNPHRYPTEIVLPVYVGNLSRSIPSEQGRSNSYPTETPKREHGSQKRHRTGQVELPALSTHLQDSGEKQIHQHMQESHQARGSAVKLCGLAGNAR